MEKKFKFSDKTKVSKIVYATVIAILCISAIVIGIVAANSRKQETLPPEDDGVVDGGKSGGTDQGNQDGTDQGNTQQDKYRQNQSFQYVF